ncbi:MAG: arsenosugar biosynthesis radical SAM protein ArsS [Oleispira sp.]|nr:arsenosugar biosynthesis radical SAM protein ArsS [Oleispira sp.]MBL4880536.1 arsenosugar biosynthesis radical SAM protein ArsS [Oleispira sp.]
MRDTKPLLMVSNFPALTRSKLEILQVNLGYTCNLSCTHCHVNAGPKRTEQMDKANIDLVIDILKQHNVQTLDLTGGAPELMPHFRYLVKAARALGVTVIDRCNLTILNEPGQEDLAQFLADYKVEVVASLPCYSEENVDSQRGKGVFESSIEGLQKLNALGYGLDDSSLPLNLVYNPGGAFLPPGQVELEATYKEQLGAEYDIQFNNLFTITNMPISRFGAVLLAQGEFYDYINLLKDSYSPENLAGVMCLNTVSVDWLGNLYDCDFNQMLEMPLAGTTRHLSDLLSADINGLPIKVADHCYGCTAGQGSSCGGALD